MFILSSLFTELKRTYCLESLGGSSAVCQRGLLNYNIWGSGLETAPGGPRYTDVKPGCQGSGAPRSFQQRGAGYLGYYDSGNSSPSTPRPSSPRLERPVLVLSALRGFHCSFGGEKMSLLDSYHRFISYWRSLMTDHRKEPLQVLFLPLAVIIAAYYCLHGSQNNTLRRCWDGQCLYWDQF